LDRVEVTLVRISGRGLPTHRHTHTHTTILRPFFRDHPGELVPEKNSWTLWCTVQGKINRGRHIDHPAGRHSIWTNQCPPPPSRILYRPDALPATQSSVKALKATGAGTEMVQVTPLRRTLASSP